MGLNIVSGIIFYLGAGFGVVGNDRTLQASLSLSGRSDLVVMMAEPEHEPTLEASYFAGSRSTVHPLTIDPAILTYHVMALPSFGLIIGAGFLVAKERRAS